MSLSVHSQRIDAILSAEGRNTPKIDALLDQYHILRSDDEREEFVAAVIHRMLVERSRRVRAD